MIEAEAGSNSVAWAEVTSAEYATAIRATLDVSVDGDHDVYSWSCPRCKHDATNNFLRKDLDTETVAAAAEPERQTITLTCGCGSEHVGQPDDNLWTGCGCYAVTLMGVAG